MTEVAARAPNLMFSHMGLSVIDVPRMEHFYTQVLGFTVTDRGHAGGMDLVFLSRSPQDHHQIVLASGRPTQMPANTANAQFGPSINQLSFKMGTIDDLREMKTRLEANGASDLFPANHGVAWSIYAHDPEGNNLEFFVDTEWYFPQPFLVPLDFTKTNDELEEQTRVLCEQQPGYRPYPEWRADIAGRMTPFVPAAAPGSNATAAA